MNKPLSRKSPYSRGVWKGIKPDPIESVTSWADSKRMLSSVSASKPGKWRTSRTPYLAEIQDCLSVTSTVERVVFMKGAQIGGTEVGLNWLGYLIDNIPSPIMMVMPSIETAKKYSRQRIEPLISLCPSLVAKVAQNVARDGSNTLTVKGFAMGGLLMLVGANSAAGLRSSPVRFVFLDEVDAYPHDVGGEGDPVNLAIQRTTNFPNRKVFLVSTPTLKGFSRIETAYLDSDQRQYWVPCPACSKPQVLEWEQVKWPEGSREKAYYQCIHCSISILEYQKKKMLLNGKWIAQREGKGLAAGFHLSGLYSPWVTWSDIAVEHGEAYKEVPLLKVWTNTKEGKSFEENAEQLDGVGLMARREPFGELLHEDIITITAGVDVQDNRVEYEIVGWGRGEESWSLDYGVVYGDPEGPKVWQALDKQLRRVFPHSRQLPDLPISAVCIDTAGHRTMSVYDYCRERQHRRVWAIIGRGGAGKPIWPLHASRNNKGKIPLFTIGIDAAKEAFLARLRVDEPGPGYCHFPDTREADYFDQITSEKLVTRFVRGRPKKEWMVRNGRRNEAFDARIYAMGALHGLIVSYRVRLDHEADLLLKVPLKTEDKLYVPPQRNQSRQTVESSWMQPQSQ